MCWELRIEALNLYHQRDDIITNLFARYINPPASTPRRYQAHKIKILALDIILNILDVCEALSQDERYHARIFGIQKSIYTDNSFLDSMVAFCIDENRIHSQNKLDMEELRLYAKAFSYLPMSFLQTRNPMVLTKLVKKAADEDCVLTIENYLKSLNLIVTSMKEEDSYTQYRALYAFFNFLMLTQHIIEQ